MPRWLETLLLAIVNTAMLAIPLITYTTVNEFSHPQMMLIYLIVINGLVFGHTNRPQWRWVWWPLYLVSLIAACYASYPLKHLFSLTWGQRFVTQLIQQTQAFRAGSTTTMPVLLSMVLIMILVLGLTLLTVHWQQPVLGIVVSIGYLLAVTLFATRNEVIPLTLTIALAGGIVSVLSPPNWHWGHLGYYALLAMVLVGGATVNTWAKQPLSQLAQATVTWRNQLSSLGFYNFLTQASAAKKTGISEDTATLGGAIQDDNSVAFKAVATTNHYWRADTRADYSGKGWAATDDETTRKPTTTTSGFVAKPTTKRQAVKLTMPKSLTYLPVGYGQTTWAVSAAQQHRIGVSYTPARGRIYLNTGKHPLTTIQYTYQPQRFTAAQLKAVTAKASTSLTKTNTQLPSELPARVKRLSQKLTRKQTTQYGRVQALVHYLKQSDTFTYTKMDTPTTPAKRDYVDYFLFTSHRGYCDNFSTTLVVMLRSLGIPARWAHGFSGGTRGKTAGNGQYHYQILNSDAHSWAEVYFAGIGWVPFDPTPGYQNPGTKRTQTKAAAKTQQAKTSSTSRSQSATTKSSSSTRNQASTQQSSSSSQASKSSTMPKTVVHLSTSLRRRIIGGLLLLLLLGSWFGRDWLLLIGLSLSFQFIKPTRGYRWLTWWFNRRLPRRSSESLTDYAATVDQVWPQLDGQFQTTTTHYLAQTFGHQTDTTLNRDLQQIVKALRKNRQQIVH